MLNLRSSFYHLTFKCELDQPTWTNVSNDTAIPPGEQCAKLFWNPCINIEVMAPTSSIYDYFTIWPSSLTLTFNLPEQMFPMALLLLKKNNYAKLFWNLCINVEDLARTYSIYDYFIIWPSSVSLIFNLPEQMFQMALLFLKENNCAKLFWNPCINGGVLARTISIYVTFKCELDLQPTLKMFQMALLLLKDNNCAKLFWNPYMNVEVMALDKSRRMHTLAIMHTLASMHTCTDACTHIQGTKIVTARSCFTANGLDKKHTCICCMFIYYHY